MRYFDRFFEAEAALTVAAIQGEPSAIPILESQVLKGKDATILNARMAAQLLRTYETEEALDAIERLILRKEARGVVKELAGALAWRGDEDSLALLERLCADQRFSDDERFQLKNARDILTGRLR